MTPIVLRTLQSLRHMLEAFLREKHPHLSAAKLESMLETMDMSVVSREYETSIITAMRSVMTGDILRMLLIQSKSQSTRRSVTMP
jgi:ATP synthase regulation protein NCA2